MQKDATHSTETPPKTRLRGWPGYRTRAERSGLDPVDAYAEQGHMQGTLLRMLFTGKLPLRNPAYLLIAAFLGIVGVLPLALLLIELIVSPPPTNNVLKTLLTTSPFWVLGMVLLVNVFVNLRAIVLENLSWLQTHRLELLVGLLAAAILLATAAWGGSSIRRAVRVALGWPPTVAAGVEITTDSPTYALHDRMVVTIYNANPDEIWLFGLYACGLSRYSPLLEQQKNGQWIRVMVLCPENRRQVSPGQRVGQYLGHHVEGGEPVEMTLSHLESLHLVPGERYRLVYYLDQGETPVYSNEFVIQ